MRYLMFNLFLYPFIVYFSPPTYNLQSYLLIQLQVASALILTVNVLQSVAVKMPS